MRYPQSHTPALPLSRSPDLHLFSSLSRGWALNQCTKIQSQVLVFVLVTTVAMLYFSLWLSRWVLSRDEGTPEMIQVSEAIREGAEGFFATQYGAIARLSLVLAVGIYALYSYRELLPSQVAAGITPNTLAILTSLSFLFGALCSGGAGYTGMWVSVRANVRVGGAARRSAREALMVALRAGGFAALIVVGMAVLGITVLFSLLYVYFSIGDSSTSLAMADIPLLLVGYGFGASFVALFAQLGGGKCINGIHRICIKLMNCIKLIHRNCIELISVK